MCLRRCCGWEVLPVIYALVAILGPTLTYTISVCLGHASALFPSISSISRYQPEAGVFIFNISLQLIIGGVIMVIRYKQIQGHYVRIKCIRHANRAFAFFIALALLALLLLAGFQGVEPLGGVHNVAAVTAFISLLIMYAIQTGITCKLQKVYRGHGVRLAVQLLLTVFNFITGIMCSLGFLFWHIPVGRKIGAFGEWAMYFGLVLYPLTFCKDFKFHRVGLLVQSRDMLVEYHDQDE